MKQEMIEGAHHALAGDPSTDPDATLKSVIQAAINDAWTRFDPQDKSTWPKERRAPSDQMWLVRTLLGDMMLVTFDNGEWYSSNLGMAICVKRYADPADILPQGNNNA